MVEYFESIYGGGVGVVEYDDLFGNVGEGEFFVVVYDSVGWF